MNEFENIDTVILANGAFPEACYTSWSAQKGETHCMLRWCCWQTSKSRIYSGCYCRGP